MKRLKLFFCSLCSLLVFLVVACQTTAYESDKQLFAMDAPIRVQLYAETQALGDQVVLELDKCFKVLDDKLSKTKENSDITKLNEHPGEWILVGQDTSILLQQSIDLAKKTNGAFNPMIGVLSNLWDINGGNQNIPSAQVIEKDLKSVDYQSLIGPNDRGEYVIKGNAQLDLGGIGKGYATDKAAEILYKNNINSALINVGYSSIFALGKKIDGVSWTIGIQDVDSSHNYFGILSLKDKFLSTSGDYEHYFIKSDIRYHHIIDPEIGYPANSGLRSVTVVGDSGVLCEAYSTAFFIMGLDQALDFYIAEGDFEAVFVTEQKEVYVTKKLQDQFEFTGAEWGYIYHELN